MRSEKIGLAIMLLFFSSMIPVLYVGAVSVANRSSTNSRTTKAPYKYDPRVKNIVFSCAPRPDCPKKK